MNHLDDSMFFGIFSCNEGVVYTNQQIVKWFISVKHIKRVLYNRNACKLKKKYTKTHDSGVLHMIRVLVHGM
jgi:hypothetical protein